MTNEWGFETRRRRITRRSLWFVLAGILVMIFDIAIINWTLTLPKPLGQATWTGVFTFGVILIVYSSSLARIPPPALSKVNADQIEKWENSEDLLTIVENLSGDETSTLLEFTKRHFGQYVLKSGTTPKGRTWTIKLLRVGYKILPSGLDEGRLVFKVILYRRDLASQRGVRRPWRAIPWRDATFQLVRLDRLIALPDWIAN